MELIPGAQLERYVVISRIGAGRTATTYHARHVTLGTHHALVVPNRKIRGLLAQLVNGAKIQAKLRHRGVVSCTDVLEWDGKPVVVLDHVQGPDLEQFVYFHKLDEERIDGIAGGLIEAVDFLHANSVIHRHLKPGNIIVEITPDTYVPRIADFNIAIKAGTTAVMEKGKRQVFGTAMYMSPEATHDTNAVDYRADLWSLGCILYFLVTGHHAFAADTTEDIFALVRSGTYHPLKKLLPDVPTRWARAIAYCLIVEEDDRLQSAKELADVWFSGLETRPKGVALAAPVGKVTLVFTDIQGSTRLWEAAEEVTRHSLHAHDAVMRAALQKYGGYEVKTEGDAFMVAFPEASQAIRFCVEVQRKLHEHPWSEALLARKEASVEPGFRGLRVRMGVHEGLPECRRVGNRADYYGPMVNRAARISGVGHGGQILISAETWEQAPRDLRAQVVETDLGEFQLRSLSGTQRIVQIVPNELSERTFEPVKAERVAD
ncbi:MAG: protein kinase [Myxococcales bacterium]|nr:protein kinase [Myxococcales bacterium]MCB9673063.1 protein kinase [Alphaproteobacteria bacterium]MCB9693733.1 protein kinase [Alphaproteobacteria bacterium]